MKRNDIVLVDKGSPQRLYGRIIRIIDSEHAEIIDCGKFCRILHKDTFEIDNDYSGYWMFHNGKERWYWMPTIRKLKQITAFYNPNVFKKNRNRFTKDNNHV
jgi:hypothetical protein